MVDTSIASTSPDGLLTGHAWLAVAGLPRCGGPCSQISKEKEVNGIITDNHLNYLSFLLSVNN
jgi:hypothetical protein